MLNMRTSRAKKLYMETTDEEVDIDVTVKKSALIALSNFAYDLAKESGRKSAWYVIDEKLSCPY